MANTSMIAGSLGDYLRARRAMASPADAGLPPTGRRRVPGLRREEVAELAGLSTDYYVRLEQGRADRPSDEVLDSLARALGLQSAETAHLRDLARPPRRAATTEPGRAGAPQLTQQPTQQSTQQSTQRRAPQTALQPALRQVVEAISATPAMIMNDRNDVLAWNRLAATLIADFGKLAPRERNMARRILLDPGAPQVHPDWDQAARNTVGILRMAAGRRPHDPELVRLVGELALGSATFRKLWASHHVHEKTHGVKRFRHPAVGDLTLHYQTFGVPGGAHHLLVIYTAPPGSPAEEALNFLASFALA